MTADRSTRWASAQSLEGGIGSSRCEEVAVEEPLELRVAGDSIAITMRTPGDDRALALGFLFAEGIIERLEDVGSVHACGRTNDPAYGNAIEVTPGPGVRIPSERLERAHRALFENSACGVCGRKSIDDLLARCTRVEHVPVSAGLIARSSALLALDQPQFARTGGVHAACAIAEDGKVLASAEDVGRHNAVDKVVGKLLMRGLLAESTPRTERACVLAVSGRASFEIVQKAAVARFACVASISAPSSLAIETARATGLVLAAFVRHARFTLYAGSERVLVGGSEA